jgi:hypothetical protein
VPQQLQLLSHGQKMWLRVLVEVVQQVPVGLLPPAGLPRQPASHDAHKAVSMESSAQLRIT